MENERKAFDLSGKNIVVTGASSGIGRQCAISCGQIGASVIMLGRDRPRLDETLAATRDSRRHLSYSVDLLAYDEVEAVVKNAVEKAGRLHGLVNCAGIGSTLPLRLLKPEKMDKVFQANVYGAINLTKIVCKPSHVSDGGASVVFVSSVMGEVGEVGKTLYGMTKGALLAASKSLALEFAPKKIRFNCVSPGVVETPMSRSSLYSKKEESLDKIRGLHPLGLGRVEDVAAACVFFLSDEARWITGANLFVDGGYTAR